MIGSPETLQKTRYGQKQRQGVLLSGRGSNFVAIADAIAAGRMPAAEIVLVLSNIAAAPGLEIARKRNFCAISEVSKGFAREEHDARLIEHLKVARVDWVILAGYMRVLTPAFIAAFPNRILNIHPSLLPAFPGLHPQRQALAAGVSTSGCTVHFVDEQVDHGAIVLQRAVPVLAGDTEESLSARILREEHLAYPEAIATLTQAASKGC